MAVSATITWKTWLVISFLNSNKMKLDKKGGYVFKIKSLRIPWNRSESIQISK